MKARMRPLAMVVAVLAANALSSAARGATICGVAVEGAVQSPMTWDSAAPGVLLSSISITALTAAARQLKYWDFYGRFSMRSPPVAKASFDAEVGATYVG